MVRGALEKRACDDAEAGPERAGARAERAARFVYTADRVLGRRLDSPYPL